MNIFSIFLSFLCLTFVRSDGEEILFPTTMQMIESKGYPVEPHEVTTEDGYILTMHRIPHGLAEGAGPSDGKPVIYLQHGLLSSSADWVVIGPENALGYLLADAGYDVWMGNARGNKYSRHHTTLNPDGLLSRKKFWNFSWHEIGIYDLAGMIDYTLNVTGKERLYYVGHSQGTTALFVLLSQRPEYNDKIIAGHCLAPVAFMSHLKSPLIRLLSPIANELYLVFTLAGADEFAPSNDISHFQAYLTCSDKSLAQPLCVVGFFLLGGFDNQQLNKTQLITIFANVPAGSSAKSLVHYGQLVDSGRFCQFDYGLGNLQRYGSLKPLDYNLGLITAPIALYYGNNDWMAAVEDVNILRSKLPNVIEYYKVPLETFNHFDFLWAIDVKTLLYNHLMQEIKSN